MKTFFPTRQVVNRDALSHRDLSTNITLGHESSSHGPTNSTDMIVEDLAIEQGPLSRFVVGLDSSIRPMSRNEIEALGDPFSTHILLREQTPQTVRQLLAAIATIPNPIYSDRRLFLVAEGGQARLADSAFEFNGRLVFVWKSVEEDAKPDLMLSTVAVADDPHALLQLAAWSEVDRSFHFFERDRSSGQWVWAGNSFHALREPSRGKGPFDSHINGSLVMKELKEPWAHWHSVAASIAPEAIPTGSELLSEPIFASPNSAHELEPIIKTAIRRWTLSRFDADVRDGALQALPSYLRQVLWCTSINLVSSPRVFGQPVDGRYPLPASFFYDADAFAFLASEVDDSAALVPSTKLDVDAILYEQAVASLEMTVVDDSGNAVSVAGDTHFAFLVPERAFEDLMVLRVLVEREVISARTALCLLFVDFSNPVFSPRRGTLLAYAVDAVRIGEAGNDFDIQFVEKVRSADTLADGPEAEFLSLFDSLDLIARCRTELHAFDAALRRRLATAAGVVDVLELAQSRRRTLMDKRSLAEFRSTMAFGSNPKAHLAMRVDASIFEKNSDLGEEEN